MSDCSRVKDFAVRLYGEQIDFVCKKEKSYGSVSKYLRYLVCEDMEKRMDEEQE